MVLCQYSVYCLVDTVLSTVGRPETQRYCCGCGGDLSLYSILLPSGLSLTQFFFSFLGPCGARRCGMRGPQVRIAVKPPYTHWPGIPDVQTGVHFVERIRALGFPGVDFPRCRPPEKGRSRGCRARCRPPDARPHSPIHTHTYIPIHMHMHMHRYVHVHRCASWTVLRSMQELSVSMDIDFRLCKP